jgi:hypothetical protein
MPHTVLLLQATGSKTTRSWYDYESVPNAVEGLVTMYEATRAAANGQGSYTAVDLFNWIDTFPHCSCMVLDKSSGLYHPRDVNYLKQQIYNNLKRQASRG